MNKLNLKVVKICDGNGDFVSSVYCTTNSSLQQAQDILKSKNINFTVEDEVILLDSMAIGNTIIDL